ncbi:MAG: acetoin utilization protein AcuC [Chloroflexi bacterium]|nr:acetoin utilization protein AcuC [Chloroflexota bacterium]
MTRAVLVGAPELWRVGRGPQHPLNPERLQRTWELLAAYGVGGAQIVPPRPATPEELGWFHTADYIDAVARLSRGDGTVSPWKWGFGPGDNPVVAGMYESEAAKTGAGLVAAEWVASGRAEVAFSFTGGMHHAMPERPRGFCIFNDPAVTIHWLLRQGLRVAYLDIDAHHGDGVQHAFYDSDRVLTISLHESGRYLFPGTGFPDEIGAGAGRGYAANLPLHPSTTDAVYLWAFREVVPPLLARFRPDVVVSQLGVDTHYEDPLTHLALTLEGYAAVVAEIARLAPRWVALGGGGYHLGVVPRAWTLAFGVMGGSEFPDELPAAYAARWGGGTLRDHGRPPVDVRDEAVARRQAQSAVAELKALLGL